MRFAIPAAAFVIGLAAGLLSARAKAPARPTAAAERPGTSAVTAAPVASMTETELLRTAAHQASEIKRLKERAKGPPAAAAKEPASTDRRARAAEIHDLFKATKDWTNLIQAFATLDEVDPSMARTFIERYDPADQHGLMLILLAGGPEASAFVARKLGDPELPPEERNAFLSHLSGTTGTWITQKLPVDAALARHAESLHASSNPVERAAAAGLLGGSDTGDARTKLRTLAESDPDANVRAAAITALGWNGDRAALAQFQQWTREPDAWAVNRALDRAIEQMKERFPE